MKTKKAKQDISGGSGLLSDNKRASNLNGRCIIFLKQNCSTCASYCFVVFPVSIRGARWVNGASDSLR